MFDEPLAWTMAITEGKCPANGVAADRGAHDPGRYRAPGVVRSPLWASMTQASREQLYRDIAASACYQDDYQSAGSDYQRLRM